MAVIMVEVPEAANRLDEMMDAVLAGEQVVLTREDQPVGMLVSLDGPGRPAAPPRGFGARGGFGGPPQEREATGLEREIIIVRRRIHIVACMP